MLFVSLCVSLCVCVCGRERERERGGSMICTDVISIIGLKFNVFCGAFQFVPFSCHCCCFFTDALQY